MMTTIKPLRLKSEVIDSIKKSLALKNRIQFQLGISYLTLQRWLNDNSPKLTEATILRMISEELDCPTDDLLNEVTA